MSAHLSFWSRDSGGRLPQNIAEGDANEEVTTNSLRVFFSGGDSGIINAFDVTPGLISPNGDGVQDNGTFAFEAPLPGIYRIYIDLNRDGDFDPLTEVIRRDAARVGRNQFVWDGTEIVEYIVHMYPFGFRLDLELMSDDTWPRG